MAVLAALQTMRDPKIAIADKLSSLDGINLIRLNGEAHEATKGGHNVNNPVEASAPANTEVLDDSITSYIAFAAYLPSPPP
eukprot:3889500-Pleurochrysis_carterae.AAC.1